MSFSKKLRFAIDQFVPKGYLELEQYDIILRSRITASFLLLSALMSFYVGFIASTFDSADIYQTNPTGLYVLGFAYLFTTLLFRITGAFCIVANMYAAISYIAMYFSSFSFGASTANPLLLFLLMVPMITFIISGKSTALFWTLLNIVSFIFIAHFQTTSISSNLTPDMLQLLHTATWVSLSVGFFFVLFFYDLVNAKLRDVISQERNHFEFEAGHDKLTGLLNRGSFQQRLAQCVSRVKNNHSSAIIGLIDLDGFKPVNDQIGHHAGDLVLKTVSSRMLAAMRKTDTLARLGGDEFAFILQDVKDDAAIDRTVNAMLLALAEPIIIDEHTVQISGSIGLARCPEDHATSYDVLRAADVAMYDAKKIKGRYRHYKDVVKSMDDATNTAKANA
jgi:diguanylate cyclase (GGDEF)-like protein